MRLGYFIIAALVPIIVRRIIAKFARRTGTYTKQEFAAIKAAKYPPYYKPITIVIDVLIVAVPIICAVWFVVIMLNSDLYVRALRYATNSNPLYINPYPGLNVVLVPLFFIVFMTLLWTMGALTLLLPAKLQDYSMLLEKGPHIRPGAALMGLRVLTEAVWGIGVLIIIGGALLFTSVTTTKFSYVSRYPFRGEAAVTDIKEVVVTCSVEQGQAYFSMAATLSDARKVGLLSKVNGPLLPKQIAISQVNALNALLAKNDIPVIKDISPVCTSVLKDAAAAAQYRALFSQ